MNQLVVAFASLAFLAATHLQASDWIRNKTPLLTNFVNMYNPCVVETPGEYRYKMWFFGWAASRCNHDLSLTGCDMIFHARSKDLSHWEVYCENGTWDASMTPSRWIPVLHASGKWYEAWHTGDPSVVLKDGRYYMAYSSTSKPFGKIPGYPSESVLCVMGAESDDGIHWTKSPAPLLIRTGDSDHPQPEPNRTGDFQRPCLRWDNGRWMLWFDYWLPGKGVCMGCAENLGDFFHEGGFKPHDLSRPLLVDWPNPEVIKIGNEYHSFSDPSGYPVSSSIPEDARKWMTRQLREAVSPDGISSWRKLAYIPPDDDSPACHVPQTLLIQKDGRPWLYLFYATQIGYRKDGNLYDYEYDRIRAMRRPADMEAIDYFPSDSFSRPILASPPRISNTIPLTQYSRPPVKR
jgi:hypothetical protein